ncbi:MAG: YdcF family protein [Oculatellaceae cyanobacterium Prado106]|jgi:uncharacterized SAM-binding protein YcdF (DUF218 family)|nr:YdcF family protein [Oculatellaceae cyanobacterium Prado106]
MFDAPQCLRTFNGVPLSFDWGTWNWLKLPILIGLAAMLVFALGWLCQKLLKQRLNRRKVWLGLGSAIALSALLLTFADRGLTAFLPADPGTPVDAIVILGRGTDFRHSRVQISADLWRTQRAPLIFVSGINDTPKMLEQLANQGIPQSALDGENCSLTTAENALFSAAILKERGVQKIILVTDRAHVWRSQLDFESVGLSVIPRPSEFPPQMNWSDRTILVLREYLFLFTSSLYSLINGQRVNSFNSPDSSDLVELAKAYGRGR